MKKITLSVFTVLFSAISFSQTVATEKGLEKHVADSIVRARKDSIRMAKLSAKEYFPLINAGILSGVLPVEGIDEIPNPKRQYKLLFEFTLNFKDSTHEKLNPGLVEIARVLNLHVASGIDISHIHAIVVAHGSSLFSIENSEAWQAKYKKDNPNSGLISELMKYGVKFVGCGQAMNFLDITKSQLHPGVKVSLTAQTVLSNYVGQGYVWFKIDDSDL